MLKAIALDDEPLPLEILSNFCLRIPEQVMLLKTFSKVMEAKAFLEKEEVDLLFLDINMPFLSGLDFYKMFGKGRLLILTTAYQEFALEGFNLSAVDYLMKPFDFGRFKNAITKADNFKKIKDLEKSQPAPPLMIKVDGKSVLLKPEEIQWIESMGDYLKIFRDNGRTLITRLTIKAILDQLDQEAYFQVHKSYIVPLSRITEIGTKSLMVLQREIPLGNTYRKQVWEAFTQKNA